MKTFLGLCAGALLLLAPASAADWKSLKPEGYVSDFAHVIDARSKAELNQYAAQVQEATGAQFAFVTLPSLEGQPIEDVANDLFHAWGVGQKKEDNGLLFLLAVQERRSRLEVGGGLGGAVPDGMAGLLLDEMRPALRQQQYGTAMLVAAQRLGNAVAESKGITIAAPVIRRPVRRATRDGIPWPLILIGIFILLMLLRGGGTRYGGGGGGGFWTGLLLGELLGGGRRGGGWGGGFGGYDSGGGGGGFGGFGGGDSGGGGASSDW